MQSVIFDSSFLMAVAETPTTWFEDIVDRVGKFQPILLDCVRDELSKLASGQGRKSRAARVGLDIASSFKPHPCGSARVDDEIVSMALTEGAIVATADSALIKSLKGAHLRVISLKQGRVALD